MTVLNQFEEDFPPRLMLPCQPLPLSISSARGGLPGWSACRRTCTEPLPPPLSPAGVISRVRGLWAWGLNTRVLSGSAGCSASADRAG